jgi:ABC-type phosphate/phosphonate transport system ATPase subunit
MATHDLDLVRRSSYRTIEMNHGRLVFDSSESPLSARPSDETIEDVEAASDTRENV